MDEKRKRIEGAGVFKLAGRQTSVFDRITKRIPETESEWQARRKEHGLDTLVHTQAILRYLYNKNTTAEVKKEGELEKIYSALVSYVTARANVSSSATTARYARTEKKFKSFLKELHKAWGQLGVELLFFGTS